MLKSYVFHTADDRGKEGIGDVRNDDANKACAIGPKRTRQMVGLVCELIYSRLDAGSCRLRDGYFPIDDMRHGAE